MRLISSLRSLLALAALGLAFGGCESQRTFATPELAVSAFETALKTHDKAELRQLFGPKTDQIKSGDPDQDRDDATILARRIEEAHKIQLDSPDRATLLVGAEQWPFAVPLVKDGKTWRFDTDEGIEELTNRRIGRNELRTIEACGTLFVAQLEFQARQPDRHFASRLMSTPGQKDGLYWDAPGGVDPSPIGPVLAMAASRINERGERIPFNGYLFKPLSKQGPTAPGGAMEYRVDGKLIRGWAVLAYPADYGQTGITSFVVSNAGTIYQRDLGDATADLAASTDSFDPGDGWTVVP